MPTKLVLPLLFILQDESCATVQEPIQVDPPSTDYGLERTVESVETERHDYVYASGQLLREVITTTDAEGAVTTEVLDFTYDASESPYTLTYTNGTANPVTYYYVVNAQGDVIRLVSANGATVAEYAYDPWGRVISATGTMAEANPLRYRGYCYDAETEFYYLQSRYYDPVICRFVNADGYASTGQGFLGFNMLAYCGNCPVNRMDMFGYAWWGYCTVVINEGQWEHNPCRPSITSINLKIQAESILASEKYSPETWSSLSETQQVELLNTLVVELSSMFGITTPELVFKWMPERSYGLQEGNTITLNSTYLGDATILRSTVHEMYHVYQWNVMNNPIAYDEPISTVSAWRRNYTPKGLYREAEEEYYNSPIEISAHWFAGQIHPEWHDTTRWPGYLQ